MECYGIVWLLATMLYRTSGIVVDDSIQYPTKQECVYAKTEKLIEGYAWGGAVEWWRRKRSGVTRYQYAECLPKKVEKECEL
jgi:hypothetical protein